MNISKLDNKDFYYTCGDMRFKYLTTVDDDMRGTTIELEPISVKYVFNDHEVSCETLDHLDMDTIDMLAQKKANKMFMLAA
ncbi:MAG: hypothetical protein HRU25_08035 [Psychrobium sp.]|nr:hypothetical protein [Psychrobium sp.]